MADERDSAPEAEEQTQETEEQAPQEQAAEEPQAPAAEEPAQEQAAETAPAAPSRPPRPGQRGGRPPRPSSAPAPARVYIKSTFNNILISITDQQGNVICWASGGSIGFSGTKKGTPFAAQLAAENAGRRAIDAGVGRVDVFCKGPGSARETAIRTLQTIGIEVSEIKDVTPKPHNGCRPKKRRRM